MATVMIHIREKNRVLLTKGRNTLVVRTDNEQVSIFIEPAVLKALADHADEVMHREGTFLWEGARG